MLANDYAMASSAGKEIFRFRLVCEPELFVFNYFSKFPKLSIQLDLFCLKFSLVNFKL